MIRSEAAARVERVAHVHSERSDGAVGNSLVAERAVARARCVAALGAAPRALVVPDQVHGACVAVVGREDCGRAIPATDGLATRDTDVPLLVQGADCPLVLLAAPGAVAVVHSGWRGTAQRIVAQGVRRLEELGARCDEIVAAVFPGIGPCCFEVGPDVRDAFRAAFGGPADAWFGAGRAGDRLQLDLAPAISWTLTREDVDPTRIDVLAGCTACGGRFFSHRGSRGAPERHGLFAVVSAATRRA